MNFRKRLFQRHADTSWCAATLVLQIRSSAYRYSKPCRSASMPNGDIFPWMFRTAKLGPLIGTRSWGGVVGITSHGQLMDGGTVNVPEFAYATAQGEWEVEGHGVDPDIVVDNDPKSVIEGHDPQLERGVAELLQRLAKTNPKLPEHAPFPVKLK